MTPSSPPIRESKATFRSGGKPIKVERFEPAAEGQYPAVMVLHGSGGMMIGAGASAFRAMARELARNGYVALVVHYFDRTGTLFAGDRTSQKHFPTWMQTVGDAVGFAAEQPEIDARRIGLLGFSLGAYVGLSEALFDDRVSAVVEFFGGLPEALDEHVKNMPPTLILHGDADPLVSVKEAHRLERLFRANEVTYEMHIYPGAGHGFPRFDAHDATRRTLAFFNKHLRPAAD